MVTVDFDLVRTIDRLSAQNPMITSFDWFVIGVLFNCPSNRESVEKIFDHVKKIADLEAVSHLTMDEKNEFLIKMVDKRLTNKVKLILVFSYSLLAN